MSRRIAGESTREARIVAISGHFQGLVFSLPEGELPIGRDPMNQIDLEDVSLSRRYCVLQCDEYDIGYAMVAKDFTFPVKFHNGMLIEPIGCRFKPWFQQVSAILARSLPARV
jgi:hypothetical protein